MPKPFTPSEKAHINQLLLEAGSRLFSSFGLDKTRVEDLAQAAGISKAAFYLFYDSKESLFFEVLEQLEADFRVQVLAVIELPGPTPRARLAAGLRAAFSLWRSMPILQFFTSSQYAHLVRRLPPEEIQAHMRSDAEFIHTLIDRSRAAGIPFQVDAAQTQALFLTLLFPALHLHDFGPGQLDAAFDALLEITAAYLLGEITLEGGENVARH